MKKIIFVFLLVLTVNCYSQELKPVKITPENIEAERAKHKAWVKKNEQFTKIAENIHTSKFIGFDDWETKTMTLSGIVNDCYIRDVVNRTGPKESVNREFIGRLAVKKMLIECFTKKEIEFLRNKGVYLSMTINGYDNVIRSLEIGVGGFDLEKELKIRHVQKFFKLLEDSREGMWKPGTDKREEVIHVREYDIDYFFTNDPLSYKMKEYKEKLKKAKK